MEKMYVIIIVVISLLVIKKIYKNFLTKNRTKKLQAVKKTTQPVNSTKNKYLYPEDGLGKMCEGVVYDSKTYKNTITLKNNTSNKMEIITIEKAKKGSLLNNKMI